MKKSERQRLIRKIIKEHKIEKQEHFVDYLRDEGVEVTQATISRDIKEMKLIKVSNNDGTFFYSLSTPKSESVQKKLEKMLRDSLLHFDQMEKFLVIKTIPGSATALGILIEKLYEKDLFSLITNDDKVLMIFYSEEKAKNIRNQIYELVYR